MATYTVSSGQTDNGVALKTGDTMTVLKGGSAINTSITGPTNGDRQQANQYVYGKATNTSIYHGGYQEVDSGGVVSATVVNNGGEFSVEAGGTANNVILNNGALGNGDGGNINQLLINSGAAYGTASGTITGALLAGGQIYAQYEAIDKNTVITSGGAEDFSFGATGFGAFNTTVDSGGIQSVDGADAYATVVNSGGKLDVSGGNLVEQYFRAGNSYNATINSGGLEVVSVFPGDGGDGQPYWAFANQGVVNSGGTVEVHAGGEAIDTRVNTGGFIDNDSLAAGTILAGGTMNDNVGGTATGTIVEAGGNEIVYVGSTAINTLVQKGGIVTDSSGEVDNSTIQAGGFIGVWGKTEGSFIEAGGEQAIYNGGFTTNSTVAGMEFIRAGGVATNEVIAGGGVLSVAGGSLTGGVNFSTDGGGELSLASNTLAAVIYGFDVSGDKIDLTALGFGPTTKATYSGSTLTVATGANHAALTLGTASNLADFGISSDGHGGTLVKFL